MLIGTIVTFINLLIFALIVSGLIYLFVLLVKARLQMGERRV